MKKIPMAAMLALAAFTLPVSAATYYVNSDTGEDVDPKVNKKAGLSEGAAFKTIQFAIDKAAAGSTILVAPGTYEPIVSNNKKLTIKAVEGAEETSIDGEGVKGAIGAELGVWGEKKYNLWPYTETYKNTTTKKTVSITWLTLMYDWGYSVPS